MIFLKDRALLEDGKSLVEPQHLERFLSLGLKPEDILILEMTAEIERFNRLSGGKIKVYVDEPPTNKFEWLIPDAYKYLDTEKYLLDLIEAAKIEPSLRLSYELRLVDEIELFEKHNMNGLLKTLIFIIAKLRENNIVWGVGRGSSCSSYILFLIGLHNVDPIKYDISIKDFIRDEE